MRFSPSPVSTPRSRPSLATRLSERVFEFHRAPFYREALLFSLFELFVAGITVKYAWFWAAYVQHASDVVLPLGIAQYVDVSFLFGSWTAYGVALLLTGAVALGATRRWRYGYLAALVLLHLLFAARYSQGEIPHSSNVLGMTLLGLGLSLPAFDTERLRRRFTLGFTVFFLGLGYTSAAVCKLVATGPSWIDGIHLHAWIYEKAIDLFAATGTFEFTAAQSLVLDHHWLATVFLGIGLATELMAVTIWWPRFRLPALLAILGLHVGIYLTMRIVFAVTTVELVLLTLLWGVWYTNAALSTPPRSAPPVPDREAPPKQDLSPRPPGPQSTSAPDGPPVSSDAD